MLLGKLHFLRPEWGFALLPLCLLLFFMLKQRGRQGHWQAVCDPHLLAHLGQNLATKSKRLSLISLAVAGLLTLFILAGPSWQRLSQVAYQKQYGQVVVFDLSSAMLAKDIVPNRLSRAKFTLRDYLAKLKEGQIGLVAYSGEPFVASPLTDDPKTIDAMVSELSPEIMPLGGSDTAAALKQAAALIKQAGFKQGRILLLTASVMTKADIRMAKTLANEGIYTSVIAFATKLGAPVDAESGFVRGRGKTVLSRLDEDGLRDLANAGGGSFQQFASDADILSGLLAAQKGSTVKKKEGIKLLLYKDQGRYFIFLLLPLALLAFRRGWLESML